MKRVLMTRRMPPPAEDVLRGANLTVDMIELDDAPPRSEWLGRLGGCAGVLATMTERFDLEALDAAGPGLRVIANLAVGFDNIDVALCRARGIRVTNTPDVLTEATADLTWALILAAARRVVEGDRLVRAGAWKGWAPGQLLGLELHGATLGVVGGGRIGTAVARRSLGFGMSVVYVGRQRAVEMERAVGARRVELDELLRGSDVVTLHVPMRPENHHLIDRRALGLLRPGAILVNAARGPVVDEQALVEVLEAGRISAAFDVYEREPRLTPGLAELPNTVLLPHLGSGTHATRARMSKLAAESIVAVLSGREPPNTVC